MSRRSHAFTLAVLLLTAGLHAADDAPPEGFRRFLPRGRIPSIDSPEFVPASKAEISPDAWVLGVVMGGQAKAYDLNLLTQHEVVNDRMGNEPIAAVW